MTKLHLWLLGLLVMLLPLPSLAQSISTLALTSPLEGATTTIGNSIPINYSFTNAPSSTQVVIKLTGINLSTGGVGGGTWQSGGVSGTGSGTYIKRTGEGYLTVPGIYEITATLNDCSFSGCSGIATSNVRARALPVRINIVSAPVLPAPLPALELSAIPPIVPLNGTTRLWWNGTNVTSCEFSHDGIYAPSTTVPNGSMFITPVTNTIDYGMTCTGAYGTIQKLVRVTVSPNAPTLSILEPNGGEAYHVGESVNVRWASSGLSGVRIEWWRDGDVDGSYYGSDDRSTALFQTALLPSSGSRTWVIPANILDKSSVSSGNKLFAHGAGTSTQFSAGALDLSNSHFTIHPAPTVTTLPASAIAAWETTLSASVNIASAGASAYFRYGKTNTASCASLTSTTPSVPLTPSVATLITKRISNLTNATPYYYCPVVETARGSKFYGAVQMFVTKKLFTATPASGPAPLKVTFGLNESLCNGKLSRIVYGSGPKTDLGACSLIDTPNPVMPIYSHTYKNSGTYTARLQQQNSGIWTNVSTAVITVGTSTSASAGSVGQLAGVAAAFADEDGSSGNGDVSSGGLAATAYEFSENLERGMKGVSVRLLQTVLASEGVYDHEITGNFFDITRKAVVAFQTKYGIAATGYVGPLTRAKLNELFGR